MPTSNSAAIDVYEDNTLDTQSCTNTLIYKATSAIRG
ncbi:hypothetical protein PF005_g24033 [Phytophthora fragariae]|uniref:Uncharacterized protein n=1 Tax=Phytophthora fragariae TaxID=53985 RepID=A0A6A3W5J4_9STRA|nr:hypothetical protein PF003_g3536 [Phytophthora fragariae]KAE8934089.1 hypothetical protein PF009_g15929 [Phytophthora fragariae]KAE8978762.1 hypothetical protein PF011_g23113 [Phytophthora fragariae]KAE9073086.1 hypothetical protein PF010_g25222 [Phytophthora fragariae]KAE9098749.1 hypothetical protein PF007_g16146 [Phytophthora fragariae]